ncbi:MAG: hypothetical protein ABJA35_11695 [Parafilimonas sp.]
MKKIYITIAICSLIACKHSTEDRIKSAVEKLERNEHSNLEYLKIDSINYSLGTLMKYYSNLAKMESSYIIEEKNIRADVFETLDASSVVKMLDESMLPSASLIVKTSHDILLAQERYDYLMSIAEYSDTSIKVYNVTYRLNYKTSDNSHESNEKAFLDANTLKPVRIDIDSIYKKANSKKLVYDTTKEKNALIQTYNFERQANNLETELRLQIASGVNYGVVLDYRVRIAKLREQAAYNKVKYYWLYT